MITRKSVPVHPDSIPNGMKFMFGGSSGMLAACFVQPLELVKNRMQVCIISDRSRPSSISVLLEVIKNEGPRTLYTGITASLLRQATYTTTRLGTYTYLFEKFSNKDGSPPSFLMKAGLGMCAGACGAFVGTPAEIALIRMTSDGYLPAAERRNYKNAFDAILRIFKQEGLFCLWRGALPTIGRAMVVNAAQLSSYSQAKQQILITGCLKDVTDYNTFTPYVKDGIFSHFLAGMFAGLITTIASMPFDIAKTRIQSMDTRAWIQPGYKTFHGQPEFNARLDAKPEYKGAVDVIVKVIKYEGVTALWKGFTPYYFRLGPHTVLTFIFLEQMNKWYKVIILDQKAAKGGSL